MLTRSIRGVRAAAAWDKRTFHHLSTGVVKQTLQRPSSEVVQSLNQLSLGGTRLKDAEVTKLMEQSPTPRLRDREYSFIRCRQTELINKPSLEPLRFFQAQHLLFLRCTGGFLEGCMHPQHFPCVKHVFISGSVAMSQLEMITQCLMRFRDTQFHFDQIWGQLTPHEKSLLHHTSKLISEEGNTLCVFPFEKHSSFFSHAEKN